MTPIPGASPGSATCCAGTSDTVTRLEICQRIVLEAAMSGTLSTTLSQTGMMLRAVTWCDQAWNDIQTKFDDWGFMRSSRLNGGGASFTTVAGTYRYPLGTGAGTVGVLAANFARWDELTFRTYLTSAGVGSEMDLPIINFDAWRDGYMMGAQQDVRTRPVVGAIAPDMTVCLGPPPIVGYTVEGDYFVAPQIFSADADVPTGLPARFHMLIVWVAIKDYAFYMAAPEVLQRAREGYRDLMYPLTHTYRPRVREGAALA